MQDLIDSQYAYTDWANAKVLSLCTGLSDAQLDRSKEMGFGTLRATLFHILAADTIWLERLAGPALASFSNGSCRNVTNCDSGWTARGVSSSQRVR